MAEIEIGVPRGRCLDRRIDHRERLEREIAAWEQARNAAGARVQCMFTTEKARAEMGRAYPDTAPPDPPAKRSRSLCRRTSGSLASGRAIIGNLGRRGDDVTAAEGSATPAERCGAAIALTAEPLSERTSSPGCPCPGRAGRG